MGSGDIAFPNLGIYLTDLPKNFTVFGFTIAFYGILIAVGMLAGVYLAASLAKKSGQNPDDYWDFFLWGALFAIAGARIYYVIFEWDYYKENPAKIFNLREGGLAIYGAVIAAFLVLFIFCKVKKKNPLLMGDTTVAGLALGQCIGRWGNFFNREVFGRYTDNIFAMRLPLAAIRDRDVPDSLRATIKAGENFVQVHPTFLYESLWNLGVMILCIIYRKHKKFDGEVILLYLAGYGLGRAWIEGIRTDQLYIHGTTVPVSQVVAIACVVVALITDIIVRIILSKKSATKVEASSEETLEEVQAVLTEETRE